MSVDKFGRSSASIARRHRPLALVPSRRLLLSAGALCRTGDFVDFKEALARNIGKPVLPSDATSKEYVDQSVEQVQLAARKSVQDSIETIVLQTHALTVQYLDHRLTNLVAELKQAKQEIEQVENNVSNRQHQAMREINDTRHEISKVSETVTDMRDRIIMLENKVGYHVEKFDEKITVMGERIIAVESRYGIAGREQFENDEGDDEDLRPSKPRFIIGDASVLSMDAATEEIIIGESEHSASRGK